MHEEERQRSADEPATVSAQRGGEDEQRRDEQRCGEDERGGEREVPFARRETQQHERATQHDALRGAPTERTPAYDRAGMERHEQHDLDEQEA